jgi:hypothetical protein
MGLALTEDNQNQPAVDAEFTRAQRNIQSALRRRGPLLSSLR